MKSIYERQFITLTTSNEINSGYYKKAIGRAILEIKGVVCRLNVALQDIKPSYFYKIAFLYNKEGVNSALVIAELLSDNKGKALLKYEFDTKDVFFDNYKANNFDAVLIIAKDNNNTIFLNGFIDNIVKLNNIKFISKIPEQKIIQHKNKQVTINTNNNINKKIIDYNTIDDIIVNDNLVDYELNEKVSGICDQTVDNHYDFRQYIDYFKDSINNIDKIKFTHKYNNSLFQKPKKSSIEIIANVFIHRLKMVPFEFQNRSVYWVRIGLDDLKLLAIDLEYALMKDFILTGFNKNKHLILGYVNDDHGENYFFGVPSIYNLDEKGIATKLGFIQFKTCENTDLSEGCYGYWLMKFKLNADS